MTELAVSHDGSEESDSQGDSEEAGSEEVESEENEQEGIFDSINVTEEGTIQAEKKRLKQRVEELKGQVVHLRSEAKLANEQAHTNSKAAERAIKGYRAKSEKLNEELGKSLETQLQLKTRVQGLEEEQIQLMEDATEKEKESKDQEKRLQEELRTQVDATTAAGIAKFEELGRGLETLTQGHQTQIEDMEKQLQQSQIEIQTLREGVNQAVNTDQDGNSGANSEQEHEMLGAMQGFNNEVE